MKYVNEQEGKRMELKRYMHLIAVPKGEDRNGRKRHSLFEERMKENFPKLKAHMNP